jgi:hypothetical protein
MTAGAAVVGAGDRGIGLYAAGALGTTGGTATRRDH